MPIISPNQDTNFYSEFSQACDGASATAFIKDLWTAAVGVDMLAKLIHRIRPYARDRNFARQVYDKAVQRYIEAIERRASLPEKIDIIRQIADEFETVELDYTLRKPRIGIVGEIYVRSHPFANSNIIDRLEELGAACDLASIGEWVYYTNVVRRRMAKRRGQFRNWFTNIAQDFFQRRIEKELAAPLAERFGPITEGAVAHVLDLARPYLDDAFEGEAVLSVGKMVEYHHEGFGGVINVMPFTCMPSTIVSTQTMRISADCDNMPILNISFDGQEDPSLTTRLEAFVEQVRQRQTSPCPVAENVNIGV